MKRFTKISAPLLIGILVCFTVSAFSTDQALAKSKDKKESSSKSKKYTPLNPPLPEGNRVDQGTVTPDRLLCSAFEEYKNAGREIRVVDRSGGRRMCPPGYHCEGYMEFGACLVRCITDNRGQMLANDPACRWSDCTNWSCHEGGL